MQPFIGEIRLFPWNWAPRGWALCDGSILAIQQNTALFSLIGTMYGGNGQTTFGLPDMRGRVPVHYGPTFTQGEMDGQEEVTLTIGTMPGHNHQFLGTSAVANQKQPQGVLGKDTSATADYYAPDTTPLTISPNSIAQAGGNSQHQNMQPYLVLNYCIAVFGIFPSRN
jgi:microcystin-dependent protein